MSRIEPSAAPSAAQVEEGLARIRRRRSVLWLVFFTYIPGAILLGRLARAATGWDGAYAAAAFVWMAAFAIAGARVSRSACPRCGRRFHATSLWYNSFTSRCLHCELPLRPGAR